MQGAPATDGRMPHLQQRKGFALLAAMWLVVAITTIALEFGLQARERRAKTINLAERVQALAAATAGIETARAHLMQLLWRADRGCCSPGERGRTTGWGGIRGRRFPSRGERTVCLSVGLCEGGAVLKLHSGGEVAWCNLRGGLGVGRGGAARRERTSPSGGRKRRGWRHDARGGATLDSLWSGGPAPPHLHQCQGSAKRAGRGGGSRSHARTVSGCREIRPREHPACGRAAPARAARVRGCRRRRGRGEARAWPFTPWANYCRDEGSGIGCSTCHSGAGRSHLSPLHT